MASNFNGIAELLKREDAASKLLDYYSKIQISPNMNVEDKVLDKIEDADSKDIDKVVTKLLTDKNTQEDVQKDITEVGGTTVVEALLVNDEMLDNLDEKNKLN